MTSTHGRAFNEWLRAQLKAKKMSQRQLAQLSGVDHSTISRLVRGDRMPSLGTATKLARGLRELSDEDDGPQYLGLMNGAVQNPTARVEYALRADESLSEAQVRQIMEYYLAIRLGRFGRGFGAEPSPYGRVQGSPRPVPSPASSGGTRTMDSAGTGGAAVAVNGGRVAVHGHVSLPPRLRPIR
jgi:transcriptional regulator with XRE-family HTH domain